MAANGADVVVVDIAESTHPVRTNDDRLVIRDAMYDALAEAFGRHDWPRCRWEDRGDGVLILVPPEIPKARLVTLDDGHLFLITSAEQAAAIVCDFLAA